MSKDNTSALQEGNTGHVDHKVKRISPITMPARAPMRCKFLACQMENKNPWAVFHNTLDNLTQIPWKKCHLLIVQIYTADCRLYKYMRRRWRKNERRREEKRETT